MPLAAHHQFRRLQQALRRRAQPLDTVFANAQYGEPPFWRHVVLTGLFIRPCHNSEFCFSAAPAKASALAALLSGDPRFAPMLSLAGRTKAPVLPAIPSRIGGFGGAAGLAQYLRDQAIQILVVATHPFAAQIRRNAVDAARATGTPLLLIERPAWERQAGDRWTEVADMERPPPLWARPRAACCSPSAARTSHPSLPHPGTITSSAASTRRRPNSCRPRPNHHRAGSVHAGR